MDRGVLDDPAADRRLPVDLELLHETLEYIRPALHADGGDVIFHGVDTEGVVRLELVGACGTCPLSLFTLVAGIERLVMRRVPGVVGVLAHSATLPDVE